MSDYVRCKCGHVDAIHTVNTKHQPDRCSVAACGCTTFRPHARLRRVTTWVEEPI